MSPLETFCIRHLPSEHAVERLSQGVFLQELDDVALDVVGESIRRIRAQRYIER